MNYFIFLLLNLCIANITARPPQKIEPQNPNDPAELPDNVYKKVLVIGGGLAGLSASLELVDRGYTVTIKEQLSVPGGKLATKYLFP